MATFRPVTEHLGELADAADSVAERLTGSEVVTGPDGASRPGLDAVRRVWERDHTLWQESPDEVANRLGWLDCPWTFGDRVGELATFAEKVSASGFTHAVVVGMGGSSLFPEVLAYSFGAAPGWLEVLVLDSTAPAAVRRLERELPLDTSLFLIASKSGTTIETRSHLDHLWALVSRQEEDPGARFVAVTDPGSALAELGRERGFRHVFENPPDIGGRFSALSYFGLVPGSLLGVDLGDLLDRGRQAAEATRTPDDNPAVRLAAALAAAHAAGRDKLTVLLPRELATFGDWIEQLVAESTGKHGVGLLPIVGETPPTDPTTYADDRVFVAVGPFDPVPGLVEAGHPVLHLPIEEPLDLGAHAFVWEFATALLGAELGINPFDQPDVAAAKAATNRVLEEGLPDIEERDPRELFDQVRPGDYIAITAFVDPAGRIADELELVRERLRDRYGVAVTVGIGPRYLHSTGQLHKGGPPTGVFVQIVGPDDEELPIEGRDYGFATLKQAQAAGDLRALQDAGLRAGRVDCEALLAV